MDAGLASKFQQLRERTEAALNAKARSASTTASESDEVDEAIEKLRDSLLHLVAKSNLEDVIVDNLSHGKTIYNVLFSSAGSPSTTIEFTQEEKDEIKALENKRLEAQGQILVQLQARNSLISDIGTLKQERFALKVENRRLCEEVKELSDELRSGDAAGDSNDESASVQAQRRELRKALEEAEIYQNVLQLLIIASKLDWAEDEHLTELMLSLGVPLIERFNLNGLL